jgi:5-methylcytosine-specific restriction endonuclease McrA
LANQIIARAAAKAQGLKRYFTGKPCPAGHICERYVSTFGCWKCTRIKGDARGLPGGSRQPKGTRTKNAELRKLARVNGLTRYFIGEPCSVGHVSERYVSTSQCCDCVTVWRTNWRSANREKFNHQERDRRAASPQKYRDRDKAWRSLPRSRAIKTEIQRKRRARKFGFDEHYTADDVKQIYAGQRGRCAYCRVCLGDGYEVDHIVPLARGGADNRRNIQLVCAPCNRRKQAKDPLKHARDLGMLI